MANLPQDARSDAGFELFAVQEGRDPSDFKPMPSVGQGVFEIRVHTNLEHRVIYVAKFHEAVYVLHVFEKRTRKTAEFNLRLARHRFAQVAQLRQNEGRK